MAVSSGKLLGTALCLASGIGVANAAISQTLVRPTSDVLLDIDTTGTASPSSNNSQSTTAGGAGPNRGVQAQSITVTA